MMNNQSLRLLKVMNYLTWLTRAASGTRRLRLSRKAAEGLVPVAGMVVLAPTSLLPFLLRSLIWAKKKGVGKY